MKRQVRLTINAENIENVLKELGIETADVLVSLEDSGATYKKLSSLPEIVDWEFSEGDNNSSAPKVRGVECGGSTEDASILFEALFALKLSHPTRTFESLTETDLEEQIQFINNQPTNFNHLAIKTVIEKEYKSAEEAKEKIMQIFKNEWDNVLSYGTLIGFTYHVYNKKKS